ncbi:MAG: hypothetical protein ABII01_06270 [Candidatus Woesearchaeota archaeon]
MHVLKRVYIQFFAFLVLLIVFVAFKGSVTGNVVLEVGDKTINLFNTIVGALTMVLVVMVLVLAYRPVYQNNINGEIRRHKIHEAVDIQDLQNFISTAKGKGYSNEEIIDGLKDHNWGEDLIERAFMRIE